MRHSLKAVIIDYGSGNLHSAKKAFVKAMGEVHARGSVLVSNNPKDLETATHIVLPGVGAFADCMSGLQGVNGMIEALSEQVIKNKKPFLGICVGMQMLAEKGLKMASTKALAGLKAT
jgi:glutamine amidotransferase